MNKVNKVTRPAPLSLHHIIGSALYYYILLLLNYIILLLLLLLLLFIHYCYIYIIILFHVPAYPGIMARAYNTAVTVPATLDLEKMVLRK